MTAWPINDSLTPNFLSVSLFYSHYLRHLKNKSTNAHFRSFPHRHIKRKLNENDLLHSTMFVVIGVQLFLVSLLMLLCQNRRKKNFFLHNAERMKMIIKTWSAIYCAMKMKSCRTMTLESSARDVFWAPKRANAFNADCEMFFSIVWNWSDGMPECLCAYVKSQLVIIEKRPI